jgi:hypothetical protein
MNDNSRRQEPAAFLNAGIVVNEQCLRFIKMNIRYESSARVFPGISIEDEVRT